MYQEAVSYLQSVIAKRSNLIKNYTERGWLRVVDLRPLHKAQAKDKRLMKFIVQRERLLKQVGI